ncbi:hypothetical protein D3C81_1390400 [compost metagenome]
MRLDIGLDQPEFFEFFQALKAQHFRAGVIAPAVFFHHLGRRLQRPVGRGKRQVGEERPGLVALLEVLQQLVAKGIGGIKILRQFIDELVVFDVQRRGGFQQPWRRFIVGRLEAVMVGRAGQQRKRTLETPGVRRQFCGQAQVPFAAHQCLVTGLAQQLGQGDHAVVQVSFVTRFADQVRGQCFGHGADAGDVVVGTGEQHRTGRRAGRRGVEVGQAQAIVGQCIEIRRVDFATEGADVGKAQVIGQDH